MSVNHAPAPGPEKTLWDVRCGRVRRGDRVVLDRVAGLFVGFDGSRPVIWWGGTLPHLEEFGLICDRFDHRANALKSYSGRTKARGEK